MTILDLLFFTRKFHAHKNRHKNKLTKQKLANKQKQTNKTKISKQKTTKTTVFLRTQKTFKKIEIVCSCLVLFVLFEYMESFRQKN